jgi:lysozyme
MRISDAGIGLIKEFEGFSPVPYLCPAGKLTIGYGHTGNDFSRLDSVTIKRAEEILRGDLKWAEAAVNKWVEQPLNQWQFDALCSLIYNIGVDAFRKSTLLRVLNAGRHDEVPAQFLRWVYAGGKVMPGLVRRRQQEAEMWLSDFSGQRHPMPRQVDKPASEKKSIFTLPFGRKN